jgi:hypothetical protein
MNNIPYVGISANEMIKRLDLHFISTREGLKKVDAQSNTVHSTSEYEQKLYLQSEWEKAGYGSY